MSGIPILVKDFGNATKFTKNVRGTKLATKKPPNKKVAVQTILQDISGREPGKLDLSQDEEMYLNELWGLLTHGSENSKTITAKTLFDHLWLIEPQITRADREAIVENSNKMFTQAEFTQWLYRRTKRTYSLAEILASFKEFEKKPEHVYRKDVQRGLESFLFPKRYFPLEHMTSLLQQVKWNNDSVSINSRYYNEFFSKYTNLKSISPQLVDAAPRPRDPYYKVMAAQTAERASQAFEQYNRLARETAANAAAMKKKK